ncbi:3-demethylubiquinone-9 3-methyltransferase [Ectothiorhodospira haloalkaliphila]|uniref:Ubiquinone biosynthesis O-methyltransferase n=1 Tax=Ectothiorhodospira haloalkaliphila TaxID=421628 RepID=W8KHU5_9GAMM|nr:MULTISPECIES: bifunctional 2-polyprenyl-6-hydroxyphenol methylase/3-demethylubiquinol 3-O-methyltransferase UbiG [Ectothiorhodospira]AHK79369.1 3-demethylubiquinone-9 3-methyltransferase [Ectothiorhodospira haloalkaliphila]MCG5494870.1 bifunctional 2-polyprenyl-6-hydroxyphenol methylase/3-demethylubiquinol 3-O-methyltransferase UbiG [Ectothiorhodospira variabilis]MCG5497725.1 bifunctional 2-polyprenyl-6-hydroxyphenol methylase/3-demethylubiquinol 3-O-methyltransferase UbiG [Ectothiorhodospira
MTTPTQESSIDPDEVARYTALADLWWDDQGPFWALHTLNRVRTRYILERLCQYLGRDPNAERPLDGLTMLDIGCGGGILSESMARLGAHVHGVDVTGRNIVVARMHGEHSGLPVTYEEVSVETLADRDTQYDVVLNMEVVEHVADLPGFMQACNRLLRPGGYGFIATINRTAASFVAAIVGAEYILRWLPRGTHQWKRFPTPGELEALLTPDGLEVIERTGVRVNPFNRRMSLAGYMGVNYMLMTHKPGPRLS